MLVYVSEHAPMIWDGLYAFDAADAELSLMPMATRRALDLVGVHLPLASYRKLPLSDRRALALAGASDAVDLPRIRRCLYPVSAELTPQAPVPDPSAAEPPELVLTALGSTRPLPTAAWSRLRALDRYVLVKLASRGKLDRLMLAYDEISKRHARS